MHSGNYKEIAIKYYLDDLTWALIPGSRLFNILKDLELSKQISDNTKDFLHRKGLLALLSYSKNEISFSDFSKAAEIEQSERRQNASKEQAKALKERVARQELEEEALFDKLRIAQNGPRNIAEALKEKYGFYSFIDPTDFAKLMDILRRVDNGVRLSEEEVAWLLTERDEFDTGYFTEELREGFHKNEAEFYRAEFEKSKDPWCAVNASGHYRKCKQSRTAESILCTIDVPSLNDRKLKSALCTTHGGVKRDLDKPDEALNLGMQAHEFTPKDFRPCTLIGAVYMENQNYALGQSWYEKAVERGYSEASVDDELRGIYMRAEKSKQETMRVHLLSVDPKRYSWANKRNK